MSVYNTFITLNIFFIIAGVVVAIILSVKSMSLRESTAISRTRAGAFWSVFWPVFVFIAVVGSRALMDAFGII